MGRNIATIHTRTGQKEKRVLRPTYFLSVRGNRLLTPAFMAKQTRILSKNWTFLAADSSRWLTARVPGCIHTDLLRHQLIPDPFWGSNETDLQWIEDRGWTYRCEFQIPSGVLAQNHVELVADGLDTLATIRLNGRQIASTDNMFVGYRLDIKKAARPGTNLLEISFASPMRYIRAHKKPTDLHEWNDPVGGCSLLRKEQCSFGWDWGPRFATCGVYKPIRLEAWSGGRFGNVRLIQTHHADGVELAVAARLPGKNTATIRGTVSHGGKIAATFEDQKTRIENPKLWWPRGHGDQPLYTVDLELVQDGQVIDTWSERIGLRTIELDRHADKIGETFQFVVNGRAIFAKGANWIPAHSFVNEAGRDFLDDLLTSAVDAHMNMIRIWGGGIYESDDFYDLCDEKGLLVWQDFMFACAQYPGDKKFLASVKAEAEYQVARLANRACLALWCGNNEIEQMPQEILKTPARKKAYEDIFYRVLPAAVEQHDGVTPYWPSSPHNPEGYEKGHNNESAGDSHFWDVWHARHPVKRYEEKSFRFCSEFGMQSYSSPEVAATFCSPKDFNVFGPAMENHQKNAAGNLIILDYISRLYRMPGDYASLAYLSQMNQAYCMKVGIEHFRRSMPCTMGALYWQLNDCWPVFSWSSIEFGGKWKALHFAAKRFFAPFLASAHVPGIETAGVGNAIASTIRHVHLHTVSDAPNTTPARLTWTLFHLNGKILEAGKKEISLRSGESRRQKTLDLKSALQSHGARNVYLRIRLKTKGGDVSEDTVFLTAPRFMDLPRTRITTEVKGLGDQEFELRFSSKDFQHGVQFDLPGIPHKPADNFFDLYPGETRVVRLRTAKVSNGEKIKKALTTRSLADSY
jgi:beta-mannosidase